MTIYQKLYQKRAKNDAVDSIMTTLKWEYENLLELQERIHEKAEIGETDVENVIAVDEKVKVYESVFDMLLK